MLVPRIKAQVDTESPAVAAITETLNRFAERFDAGPGYDMRTPDAHAAEQLFEVMLAHLRRANVTGLVQRHACPHVPGLEEPTWGPCSAAQYGYSETVI